MEYVKRILAPELPTLIVFNSLRNDKFEFLDMIAATWRVNYVCFKDCNSNWFRAEEPELLKILGELAVDRKLLFCCGHSSGGATAIKMGCLLNAAKVLAFAPQSSLSLELNLASGWDSEIRRLGSSFDYVSFVRSRTRETRYKVVYCPRRTVDQAHALRYATLASVELEAFNVVNREYEHRIPWELKRLGMTRVFFEKEFPFLKDHVYPDAIKPDVSSLNGTPLSRPSSGTLSDNQRTGEIEMPPGKATTMKKAFWWPIANFGDTLTPVILGHFLNEPVAPAGKDDSGKIMAVGSILHYLRKNDVVWGTGIIQRKAIQPPPNVSFLAVRGPLTRNMIEGDVPKVYGDPAVLLPLIYNPHIRKTHKIGIIPHYVDAAHVSVTEEKLIDVRGDWKKVVDDILSCELIISSSLHGIIVAEAYGIPAVWAKYSDGIIGGELKFQDYFLGSGRTEQEIGRPLPPFEGLKECQQGLLKALLECPRSELEPVFEPDRGTTPGGSRDKPSSTPVSTAALLPGRPESRHADESRQLEQHLRQAQSFLSEGNQAAAVRHLEEAVRWAPHDPDLLATLGNLHAAAANVERARSFYSRALVADPQHAEAKQQLVKLTLGSDETPAIETATTPAPADLPVADTEDRKLRHDKPPLCGNAEAFAHLAEGFELVKQRQFAAAQAASNRYQERVNYDGLDRVDNRAGADPKVSVVIVACNTGAALIACLDSLADAGNPPHEIIIVDNGGNESVEAELRCRELLHVRCPINVLPSEGRNIGVHFARAALVSFVDDDAIAAKGYLASVVEAFETFEVHAIRGRVLPKTDHPHNGRARHYNMGDLPFPADIDTEGNSAFRVDVWRQFGGQDPLLFGGEGVEISYRISNVYGDLVLMYWPFMVIQHDYAVTNAKLETKSSRHVLMREYAVFKHPDLHTFHNRLVAFSRGAETKAEGNRLLPRRAQTPNAGNPAGMVPGTDKLFFSICIPTYNRARFILQSLRSALDQSHRHFEVVVVDDGSTDNTAEVMKGVTDPRVRFIVKQHSGGPKTRNRCIAEARGEYLVWLDSDDVMLSGTLERYARTLLEHPEVDVLYGNLLIGDENLNPCGRWVYPDYDGWGASLLSNTIIENKIPNVCTLVRKTCYSLVGGYDPDFTRAHDYEFWARLVPVARFKSVNADVGVYRRHESSLSRVKTSVDTSHEANAVKGLMNRHSLVELFPHCYGPGNKDHRQGDALAWIIASLLMLKHGDHATAKEYVRRSMETLPLRQAELIESLISPRRKPRQAERARTNLDQLIDTAVVHFASGNCQPCAQACAQLTELEPDSFETLLLVALSLRRWSGGNEAKTAFECLILRACEQAYIKSNESAVAPVASMPGDPSLDRLTERLERLFEPDAIPRRAIDATLEFVSELADAAQPDPLISQQRERLTPLFNAIVGLTKSELKHLVDPAVAGKISKAGLVVAGRSRPLGSRKPGYSFCIISGGARPGKVQRQIDSIRSLQLSDYEIIVGGEVSRVSSDVIRVNLPDAARHGRLGKMRNELARRARFDHLVISDDDMVFDPEFAEGLARFGEGYDVMAARILNPDGSRFWDWATSGGVRGSVLLNYWESDPKVYITGGFCVLKSHVIDSVKWDDARGFYEGEDVDFSVRLAAAGFTIRYNPFSTVVHDDDNYTRVGRKVMRFNHLLGAARKSWARQNTEEARRYVDVASRVAANQPDRRQAVESLVHEMGESEWFNRAGGRSERPGRTLTPARARVSDTDDSTGINWSGSFFDFGSLSNINRALTDALEEEGTNISRIQVRELDTKPPKALRVYRRKLAAEVNAGASLTVRHAWPPDWSRPATGKLAVIQPWEFGSLPKQWVDDAKNVDAFWVPSNYVKRVYVESGVPESKVHVVPNGIDPKQFRPDAKPLKLQTTKTFKFLFVGGTIHRKGPDVLLKSYCETFSAKDDVCLVIKDFGGRSVYAGQTLEQQIEQIRTQPGAPEIVYLNEDLPPADLPGLFTACDCLVHPYRGEGFGMPVLEAMACGLPVVVTAGGSTDDFVPIEAGYHIPSVRKVFGRAVGDMPLAGDGWLLEPDLDALKWVMRRVFSNQEEAADKGSFGSAVARENYTWEQVAKRVAQLVNDLASTEPSNGGVARNLISRGRLPAVADARQDPAPARSMKLPAVARLGHVGTARELLKQRKLVAAWDTIQDALIIRPFHPEAYLLMAEIAWTAGEPKLVKDCIDRVLAMTPNWKPAKKFIKSHPARKASAKVKLSPLPPVGDPSLTVCLIAKNEEQFIGQCLDSIKSVVDQIVVVDTGSTDRTVEISKARGAEVHHFDWCDDFSAARNAALEHATGDWVLVLDADEVLSEDSISALKKSVRTKNAIGWRLPIVDQGHEAEGCSYVARLFRNAPGLFYVSRVHEQVFSSVEVRREEWGMTADVSEAKLLHYGYSAEMVKARNKTERNLKLLEKAIEEIPGDPNLLMNYGLELVRSERLEEGLRHYTRAFEALCHQPPKEVTPELRETLLTQYASHLMKVKNWNEIVRVLNSETARSGGLTASLHFSLGLAHQELREWNDAAGEFRQCLESRHQKTFYLSNKLIAGGAPRHCLALALWKSGDCNSAAREFSDALKEDPSVSAIQLDHARFLLDQDQPVEALQQLHTLVVANGSDQEAWVMGGRIALSDPDFIEFARDWTAESIRQHPDNHVMIAQRAETLMVTQQYADALPLWYQLNSHPRAAAARILCELMQGEFSIDTAPANEHEVSREFLNWYRCLVRYHAADGICAINERFEMLRILLPSAVSTLESVIRLADVEAA